MIRVQENGTTSTGEPIVIMFRVFLYEYTVNGRYKAPCPINLSINKRISSLGICGECRKNKFFNFLLFYYYRMAKYYSK